MTHICFVVDHFPVRSETFIREQVIGLNRRGHRVSVLARGPGPGVTADEVGELASQGVEIVSDCRLQGNRFGQAKQLASVVVRSPSMSRWLKPSRPWHGREAFDAEVPNASPAGAECDGSAGSRTTAGRWNRSACRVRRSDRFRLDQ